MKIALFTGTAYRHLYYANIIATAADLVLHVRATRSNNLIDEVKDDIFSESDRQLLKEHSDLRLQKEKEYFLPLGERIPAAGVSFEVPMDEINGEKVVRAVQDAKPDVVLVYGTGLIKEPLLSAMPKWLINLHAGLSPYFRGAATLYWPIYFMKPQHVGFTLHCIDPKIDHGAILHQNRPQIEANDTIHDLGCKTIVVAASDMLKLLKKIEAGTVELHAPKSEGKIFYESDFKPYHLRVTDFLMKGGLLREYVENKARYPDPKSIVRQV